MEMMPTEMLMKKIQSQEIVLAVQPSSAGPTIDATMIDLRRKRSANFINLRRENKIIFRQSFDFMCPNLKAHPAVSQKNIGMMPLLLGDFADAVGELQCLAKIWKFELLFQSLPLRKAPAIMQLMFILPEHLSFERHRLIVTVFAFFFCKF